MNIPRILGRSTVLAAAIAVGVPSVAQAQQYDEGLYDALEWSNLGPARGGRSIAVAGSDSRPNEYYFGATGGGLWKTTDGGVTWNPVTDGQITTASIGAVQVCEANPDVVYIGGGEVQLRGNVQQGDGIYRSDDAGETWRHIGLEATQNTGRIRIHPDDCDVAWVAALGMHSASNPERGVYKTTDGGETWEQTLFVSDEAGAVDLVVDANDPDVLYASIWEVWRKSWALSSGGDDSGLWKSTDGGETWTDITDNLGLEPRNPVGKIGVAVSPANSQRVWAIVEHQPMGGVYRSDDGGATWEYVNDDPNLRQRAFYYTRIYADPQDEDKIYGVNVGFYRSDDGGENFDNRISVPHGDNHDLWISPSNPDRMINANDGGANVSINGGETWTGQQYPTAQFYRVVTTEHEPYHICGAQQDNSTACMPSGNWDHLSAAPGDYFYAVGGCESGYIAPHPVDTDIFYAGCYGGALTRYDHATGITRAVNVWPENPMGHAPESIRERVQWTFPIVFDRLDPNIVYTGTHKVWRTDTEGQSWDEISPDLTRAIDSTMTASGGPITKDETGVETFATVFAIAPSYHDPNVIWAGSDDGWVWVTRDGRAADPTWENVTPPDAPYLVRINTIEASPTTPGKAYVAGIRYLVENDRSPYVWKTEDYGQTWTKIVNGIPEDDFIRAVREDPNVPGMLYAASERTVYVSWNDGESWQPLDLNLPTVQVSDLAVEDHDLVIGTHGRSFWVMRDIDVLRQLTPEVTESDFWLFDPRDPIRGFDRGGVRVYYHLAEEAEELTLDFLDMEGNLVTSFASSAADEEEEGEEAGNGPPREAGSHTFSWNMRDQAWTDFEGRIFWAAGPIGPALLPGPYQVRLTVDGESQTRDFEIRMNPRSVEEGVTMADLEQRFEFAMQLRDRVSEANDAVIQIRDLQTEIQDRMNRTERPSTEELAQLIRESLAEVEEAIYQTRSRSGQDPLNYPIRLNNKLAALLNLVEGSENRPTDQSYDVYEVLSEELQVELDDLTVIIEEDIARLNQLLQEEGLPTINAGRLVS